MRRVLAGLLLAGCPGDPPPPPPDSGDTVIDTADTADTAHTADTAPPPPSCELGTGELTFEPMPDPPRLPVVRGPQGGWHVWGSVRCTGLVPGSEINDPFDPNNPTVTWVILDAAGEIFAGYEDLPRPWNAEGAVAYSGEQVVVWTNTYEEAIDRTGTMSLTIRDASGVEIVLEAEVSLIDEGLP